MAAKKKPLEVKPAQLGEVRLVLESMALPPDRPPGRIVGEGADAVPELLKLLQTEAKVLWMSIGPGGCRGTQRRAAEGSLRGRHSRARGGG